MQTEWEQQNHPKSREKCRSTQPTTRKRNRDNQFGNKHPILTRHNTEHKLNCVGTLQVEMKFIYLLEMD